MKKKIKWQIAHGHTDRQTPTSHKLYKMNIIQYFHLIIIVIKFAQNEKGEESDSEKTIIIIFHR